MQNYQPKMSRFTLSLMIVTVAFCVTGTQACQENYYLAKQYSGSPTETPSESPSETATEEDEDVTATPTSTGTATSTPTEEEEEDETPTATPTATPTESAVYGIFRNKVKEGGAVVKDRQANRVTNWLGNIASKGIDRDEDGFSDELELRLGSAPDNTSSIPEVITKTKLSLRMRQQDSDLDGLNNQEELLLGADPNNPDSDGDGVLDGIEVLSGRSPLQHENRFGDSDGDGLSDEYENSIGTNSAAVDSDGFLLNT